MDDRVKELVNKYNSAPPVEKNKAPKPPAKDRAGLKQSLKGTNAGVTKSTKDGAPAGGKASTAAKGGSKATAGPSTATVHMPATIQGKQKVVLDALKAADQPLTFEEIKTRTGCDLVADKALYDRMVGHENVLLVFNGSALKYKPKFEIYDKVTLLDFVRKNKLGTLVDQIKDCYRTIVDDLRELAKERKILYMQHPDPTQESVFPLDLMDISCDEDVVNMYHEIEVPGNVQDLQQQVVKHGLRSQLERVPIGTRPVHVQKDRKRPRAERAVDINKATNKHLPQLFMGAAPKNIDEK